eukprot:TRINITY_DN600_c0_g1_i1.p1 TRINITY_DN600_c0_g1~~TRINITY_DN600_c0_g1_i1.p1  ORF type:complete len:517 (-),score=141.40 TRINITY_DN600_c0_g1_i1:73-1419(-)
MQQETFTSINLIGALTGSMIVFQIGDKIGRKGALALSAFWYIVGSVIIVFTPLNFNPWVFLMIGQVCYGFGVGFGMHSAPLYIAEIAPSEIRGFLVAMKEQMIVVGILMGYVVGFFVQDNDNGWRYVFVAPIAISFFTLAGLSRAPESPRLILLRQGLKDRADHEERPLVSNDDEARDALKVLRTGASDQEITKELLDMKNSLNVLLAADQIGYKELFRGNTFNALQVGVALVFFQQITGQPSVLAYAPQIFRQSGFGKNALAASMLVGLTKLLATGIAVATSDKYGRKPLLMIGTSGMFVALISLAVSFFVSRAPNGEYSFSTGWGYVTLVSLMVYVSCYQVGYGPMVWLLQSEIFPLNARSRAQSIAVWTNFAVNFFVAWTFLSFTKAVTVYGSYSLYAVLCIASNLFVFFRVPETKGKTLEEIQGVFQSFYATKSTTRTSLAKEV